MSDFPSNANLYYEAVGAAMYLAGEPPEALKTADEWATRNRKNRLAVMSEYFTLCCEMLTDRQRSRLSVMK